MKNEKNEKNEKMPWPGTGPEVRADMLRMGEQFYRQDEADQVAYTKLCLSASAESAGRSPGGYFLTADTFKWADHIQSNEMVRKVWTGNS